MRKILRTLFVLSLLVLSLQSKAQITIGTVDAGSYTPGSSIAATFKIDPATCIQQDNIFTLVLVSPSGTETNIGTYPGFYSTFVNGSIPNNTAAGVGYKLRIKSSSPASTSTDSAPFNIQTGAAVQAAVTSFPELGSRGDAFGYCPGKDGVEFDFTNASTAGATVTGTIGGELSGAGGGNLTFSPTTNIQTFTAALSHYTVFITAKSNGTVGTRAYMIINNNVFNTFSTSGTNVVCLPGGFLEYGVDVLSSRGIQNNYPGNTYQIKWGDGNGIPEVYTLCDLKAGFVRHMYNKSSCGNPPYSTGGDTRYNVFGINIAVSSPFCGLVGGSISTYVKVVTKPENSFTAPQAACTGSTVFFSNTSIAGQDPATNTPECSDNNVRYNWYVNGVKRASNVLKSANFSYQFTANGVYTITLESVTTGVCNGDPVSKTICIQNPPQPIFDFDGKVTTGCAPFVIQATDRSIIDANCNADNTYRWIVTPSAGVSFVPTDKNPTFTFSLPGTYNIVLEITTASCGVVSTGIPQKIILVDGTPTAVMSGPAKLCGLGKYTFGPSATSTRTTFTGTQSDLPDTYTWSVTAEDGSALPATDYSFDTGNDLHTKYPSIIFNEYKTYKVSVIHKNSCGNAEASQLITFAPAPIPAIAPVAICYDAPSASLTATITNGTYTGYTWSTPVGHVGGTFSSTTTTLTPTYTPTQAERNLGKATVILTVNTGQQGDCATVSTTQDIIIYPNNTGTAKIESICTGTAATYALTSTVPASIFTWTAENPDGNASGFTATGGAGDINEILTNNNATANAIVIYTITPKANGCNGVPFRYTVTVTPRPVLTTDPSKTICSNNSAAITVTSNVPARYTWTTTATAGITGNSSNPTQGTLSPTLSITDVLINSTLLQGTVTYTITPYSATGCAGTPVTVTVLVDPATTIANAGPDENICEENSYVLKANKADVGTGEWSLIQPATGPPQTGVIFEDKNNPNTKVSGLSPGNTYTFRWTISAAGACPGNSDDVIITVNMPTTPGTTSTINPIVCAGQNTGTITLTGNVGTVLKWQSSTDGTTWVDIANTTTTLNYTNLTVNTQYKAIVQNGSCSIQESTVTAITVTPATTIATAGPDQFLCDVRSTQLDGSIPQNGDTGIWTMEAGNANAVITNPADPKTTVTGLVSGGTPYVFRWTITGVAPCGPTTDDVTITNYPPITNTINTPSLEVCNGQVVVITGAAPTGGDGTNYTYTWENSTDGTTWNTITGETGPNLSYTLTATLSFRRNVFSGGCSSASNVLRIVAQPPITNNTIAAAQSICNNTIPNALTGSTPAGSDGNFNYQWQSSLDGAAWTDISGAVAQGYSPPALTATTYYRRIVSTITCNGALRNFSPAIIITVRPDAKAEYTYSTDKGCTPFIIDAQNIRAVAYPDRNAEYIWYVNDVEIGRGITFPGYTITNSNESVNIKLVTTTSVGCKDAEFVHAFSTNQSVPASFTQSATQGCGPLVVNFVNTSISLTNATFRWDFGNGTTSTQTMPAPVTFLPEATGKDTTYTVTLTSTTSCGSNTTTSTVFVKAKPVSVFSPSRTVGCSPMRVTFSNTSPGTTNTYYYDFGDGTLLTKTDKSDVEHTYVVTATTDFTVKMVAENECGRDESSYVLRVSPQNITPELVVNANEKEGCAPLTVTFFNNSRGASSFTYDFGDGGTLNTRTSPERVQHTFTRPGTYTVTLRAMNSCSDITVTETITVLPQPIAAFDADITLGCPGLPVQFRNTTQDGFSYVWDFGDGTTSDEFEPKHIYNGDQEFYTVTLTATNTLGCSISVSRNQFIHIVKPPVAQFNVAPSTVISIPEYTFRFEDESTNNPTIWAWDFGDGTSSALQNPSHTYPDTGTYTVTLRVANQQGCFTTTFKKVQIVGVPGYLYVPNSFMPGSPYPELREFKAKGSGIKTWKMSVFNKWGQTLWETTELNEGRPVKGWDGTFNGVIQPQGVFFWKIDIEFVNGTEWKGMTYDSSAPKKTGVIHLLR